MYKNPDKQRAAIREATRRYRAKKGDSALSGSKTVPQNARELLVLDEVSDTHTIIPVRDGYYEKVKAGRYNEPKTQSHNSMMIGYVPPKD